MLGYLGYELDESGISCPAFPEEGTTYACNLNFLWEVMLLIATPFLMTQDLQALCVCSWLLSCVQLSVTPWTVTHQSPLPMGILQARILEWVAMPFSRGFYNPGIETRSLTLQVDSLPSELPGKPTLLGSPFHLCYYL